VFFKTTSMKPVRTNALITTKAGREVSLSLISSGKQGPNEAVDYVVNFEGPRGFLLSTTHPSALIAESKTVVDENSLVSKGPSGELPNLWLQNPHWKGKALRIAVGRPDAKAGQTAVPFAILNTSSETIEILPPQIELSSSSKGRKRKDIKAEPVPIAEYTVTTRILDSGARADGVVVFERPTFKESGERLLLVISQASQVDRPTVAEIAFVSATSGGAK